jgi:hypothetical protein
VGGLFDDDRNNESFTFTNFLLIATAVFGRITLVELFYWFF